jgi:hypothetical protein
MQVILFRQVLKVAVISTGWPLHPEPFWQPSHFLSFHLDDILKQSKITDLFLTILNHA